VLVIPFRRHRPEWWCYRLVTFAQSFHWTDEHRAAEAVFDLLEPGGSLALIAHTVDGRPIPNSPGYPPVPHDEIREVVARYRPSKARRTGSCSHSQSPLRGRLQNDVVGEPRAVVAPGVPDVVRDIESVLSGYLSMATSAPHLFGSDIDGFSADVRALLAAGSAEGLFWDWPGGTEIVLASKPR
jgi:hypothetical protein